MHRDFGLTQFLPSSAVMRACGIVYRDVGHNEAQSADMPIGLQYAMCRWS